MTVARGRDFGFVLILFAFSIGMLGLAGCDSAGPQQDNPPNDPPTPGLSPAEAAQAVEAIESSLDGSFPSGDTPPSERNFKDELLESVQKVRSLSPVDTVVVHEDVLSATAVLKNGIPFIIANNRANPPGAASAASPSPAPSSREEKQSAKPRRTRAPTSSSTSANSSDSGPVLPASNKAVAAAVAGGGGEASVVRGYLEQAGYDVAPLGGSLQDMRQYGGAGVLYLDTHASAYLPAGQIEVQGDTVASLASGTYEMALQTSTEVRTTEQWFVDNAQALQDGTIALSAWPDSTGAVTAKVAITEDFVEKHWTLADGAFAMIHSCLLGANARIEEQVGVDFSAMRNAVLQSANALITFDGYTNASYAKPSIDKTFEILLGRDPHGRPWDLSTTRSALGELGLLTFERPVKALGPIEYGGKNFVNMTFDSAQPQMLAPSVQRIHVVDDADRSKGRLRFEGKFGPDDGKVLVSGTEISVENWKREEVVASTPFSGPTSTGSVRIERPKNVESNRVNLTKWRGNVEGDAYLLLDGQPRDVRAESDVTVVFRADVHPTLDRPLDESPDYPDRVTTYISPATQGAIEGKGAYTDADGSTTRLKGRNDYQILSKAQVDGLASKQGGNRMGAARRASVQEASPDALAKSSVPTQFGGEMTLRPKANQAEMCFGMMGFATVETTASDGSTTEQRAGFPYSSALTFENRAEGTAPYACLPATLSENLRMTRSDITVQTGVEYRMKWGDFQAENPPRETSP
jgi:hypothetical protein